MNLATPKSYQQILKSSFVIGGASFINILLGIVRTKLLALLVGPVGIGVLAIYNSIVQTASAICGLGIGRSGVRQIAQAAGTDALDKCAKPAAAIQHWSLVLGVVGGLATFLLRNPISKLTFQDTHQSWQIGWLGLAVFAAVICAGQMAVIQGTRHVRFLAQQNILGSLLGTLVSLVVIWNYGRTGIIWVVVLVSLTSLASSWAYLRKLPLMHVRLAWNEFWAQGRGLIELGVVLMSTGLLSSGTLLLVRAFINRQMDEAATGYFQAAFGISSIYLDFILQAMGTDFYPRLSSAAQDNDSCNRLVNEQMEVALLMAGPLILAMLTFAGTVIPLLYAKDFGPACELLRWQMLGSVIKVTAWPVGFIFLAKNQGIRFFVCELLWNCTYLGTILVGLKRLGLVVVGSGFLAAYVLLLVIVLMLGKRSTGFRLSTTNRILVGMFCAAALTIFLLCRFAPPSMGYGVSTVIIIVCGWWSFTKLYSVIGAERVASVWRRILR